MVVDHKLLDSLGLGMATLYSTKGSLCAENFEKVIEAFSPSRGNFDSDTRGALADGFNLWGLIAPATLKQQTLHKHKEEIYQLIIELIKEGVDPYDPNSDEDYKGNVYIASRLAHALLHAGQSDSTMELMAEISPLAYRTIEEVLPFCSKFDIKNNRNFRDTPSTLRTDLLEALLHTVPTSPPTTSTMESHEAFLKVIYPMLSGTNHAKIKAILPHKLKQDAEVVIGTLLKVSESSIVPHVKELLDLGKNHGCHLVFQLFASCAALYYHNPILIHDNIDVFINSINNRDNHFPPPPLTSQSSISRGPAQSLSPVHLHKLSCYLSLTPLFIRVAEHHPSSLINYVELFIQHLSAIEPGSLIATLSILQHIAKECPSSVLVHIEVIFKYMEEASLLPSLDIEYDIFPLYVKLLLNLQLNTQDLAITDIIQRTVELHIRMIQQLVNAEDGQHVEDLESMIISMKEIIALSNKDRTTNLIMSLKPTFLRCQTIVTDSSSALVILKDWLSTTVTVSPEAIEKDYMHADDHVFEKLTDTSIEVETFDTESTSFGPLAIESCTNGAEPQQPEKIVPEESSPKEELESSVEMSATAGPYTTVEPTVFESFNERDDGILLSENGHDTTDVVVEVVSVIEEATIDSAEVSTKVEVKVTENETQFPLLMVKREENSLQTSPILSIAEHHNEVEDKSGKDCGAVDQLDKNDNVSPKDVTTATEQISKKEISLKVELEQERKDKPKLDSNISSQRPTGRNLEAGTENQNGCACIIS